MKSTEERSKTVSLTADVPDFMHRLREETRPHHKAVEQVPLLSALFRPGFTRDDYCKLLKAMYGFYQSHEAQLQDQQLSLFRTLWQAKAPLLAQDLLALGMSQTQLDNMDLAPVAPALDSPEPLLGAVYVFEGATLGGKVISKQLHRIFVDQDPLPMAFYQCYGQQVGIHWKRVQNALNAVVAEKPELADEIIQGAQWTFASMTLWLDSTAE